MGRHANEHDWVRADHDASLEACTRCQLHSLVVRGALRDRRYFIRWNSIEQRVTAQSGPGARTPGCRPMGTMLDGYAAGFLAAKLVQLNKLAHDLAQPEALGKPGGNRYPQTA